MTTRYPELTTTPTTLTTDGPQGTGSLRTISTSNPQNLGSPAPGSALNASASDHVHQMPNAGDVGAIPTTALTVSNPASLGSLAAPGSSSDVARLDHVHPFPSASDVGAVPTTRNVNTTSPLSGGGGLSGDLNLSVDAATTSAAGVVQLSSSNPQDLGTASAGSTGDVSDAGHVHAMPAFPPAYIPLSGLVSVDGTLGTVAVGGSPGAIVDTAYTFTGRTTTWNFIATAAVSTAPAQTGTIELWDVTAAPSLLVSLGPINTTSPASYSAPVPSPLAPTLYEVRMSVTGGTVGDVLTVNGSALQVTWA